MFQFTGFPTYHYLFMIRWRRITAAGFPHSDIRGSKLAYSSPRLFAVNHVLLRLLVPRHSPYALVSLIVLVRIGSNNLFWLHEFSSHHAFWNCSSCNESHYLCIFQFDDFSFSPRIYCISFCNNILHMQFSRYAFLHPTLRLAFRLHRCFFPTPLSIL